MSLYLSQIAMSVLEEQGAAAGDADGANTDRSDGRTDREEGWWTGGRARFGVFERERESKC